MSTTPPLQFRCWDTKAKHYITEVPPREYMLDCDEWHHESDEATMRCPANPLPLFGGRLQYEQSTGFPSAAGHPIYLNDVVRFTYAVGDLAWEYMDEAETRVQERMSGRAFMGQVVWLLGRFEIDCPLGTEPLSPAMRFPASYVGGAEVLGNVNEHPDWRAKWLPDYTWIKRDKE